MICAAVTRVPLMQGTPPRRFGCTSRQSRNNSIMVRSSLDLTHFYQSNRDRAISGPRSCQLDPRQPDEPIRERLRALPTPDWLIAMQEHLRATGTVRPEALRRLLGD